MLRAGPSPPVRFDGGQRAGGPLSSPLPELLCPFTKRPMTAPSLLPWEHAALKCRWNTALELLYVWSARTHTPISRGPRCRLSSRSRLFLAPAGLWGEPHRCSEHVLSTKYFASESDARMASSPVSARVQSGVRVESRFPLRTTRTRAPTHSSASEELLGPRPPGGWNPFCQQQGSVT